MRLQNPLRGRHHRGVSMIEVLVVIVLFSFGLIGVVGLQAKAVQNSVSAEDFNRAAMLANEVASEIWTNQSVILNPNTITAWNTAVGNPTGRGLPNGQGTVTVAGNVATITITWRAPHDPVASSRNYVTHVQLVP